MDDKQINVLLIEDNPGDARLIVEMLSDSGVNGTHFDVESACRLSDGLTRIQKGGIDAILLDLGLPDSAGIGTFEKVYKQAPEVPVVMLTGLDDAELALEGVRMGAQDYLVKGRVDGDLLARTLRYAIERMTAEARIKHLNSVLKAIRNVNQLIVTETERGSLLKKSCDALVDARGYDAAWFGVLEDGETFDMVVGSGFREYVSRFIDRVVGGDHPACIRDALFKKERVRVVDKTDGCGDCFSKDACLRRAAAIIRVEHADRFFGLLAVLLAPGVAVDDEEKGLLAEVASDIGIALHNSEVVEKRKVAVDALSESEEKYRTIYNNTQVGLYRSRLSDGKMLMVNSRMAEIFGYDSPEKAVAEYVASEHYADPGTREELLSILREHGKFTNFEDHITRSDGSVVWIQYSGTLFPEKGYFEGVATDITDRKVAEERLRVAGEQFKMIVETAPSILMISDAEGKNTYVSPNCEEFTGYDPDEITYGVMQWVHEDDAKRAKNIFDRTFGRGVGCKDFEYKAVKKDGDVWYASSSWEPLITAKGEFSGAISQTIDITDRKAAEDALLESEGKYRSLMNDVLDTSDIGIFILDNEFKIVWINRSTERYFGLKREDVIGKDKRQLIRKRIKDIFEDPETFEQKVFATYDDNNYIENFECRVLPDEKRKEYWLEHWSQPIQSGLYKGGRIEHYSDITERKAAEDALKESEERYRALFETAKDAIFLSDETGKFMEVNSAACGLLGYSKEELLKLSNREIDANPRGYEALLKIRNGPIKEAMFEVNQRRKDGTLVPAEVSGKCFEIGERKLFLAIARDITERKAAADALKESERRYKHLYSMVRLMCDNLPDLIWTKDMEGKFIFVNKACCDILLNAIDTDEPIEKDDIYFARRERGAHPENPEYYTFGESCIRSDAIVMETKEPQRFDEFGNLKGEFVYFDVYKAPFWDEEHNMMGIVGCSRVVTKERAVEDQIKRSLQEKEVLLREIHHRVKNNLQVVSSLLNMQARNVKDKRTIEVLSESRDRIRTMSLIHSQLYGGRNLAEINMKEFVDMVLGQLFQSYPVRDTRITHVVRVDDYPFPISTAVPVGLIINELLSNALKHAFKEKDEGKIEVRLTASDGGRINLTVSDDGSGLPPGFDINESKTLGLRLVKILAEDQLQGTLEVTSDGGVIFEIEFEMETG
ncbi:MAG: PAS domain S-box protein [Euryarchaeota archaeon]|nr:PAS domain S-box protein [Euryarchaeota archaeon]